MRRQQNEKRTHLFYCASEALFFAVFLAGIVCVLLTLWPGGTASLSWRTRSALALIAVLTAVLLARVTNWFLKAHYRPGSGFEEPLERRRVITMAEAALKEAYIPSESRIKAYDASDDPRLKHEAQRIRRAKAEQQKRAHNEGAAATAAAAR